MSEHNGVGEVIGCRVVLQRVSRCVEMACPELDVEDDIAGEGIGLESPKAHLIEQIEYDRVEPPAPVEPEQEQESLGLDVDAEGLELADKLVGSAEARGEAGGGGEEAVEGGRRVEIAGAAGTPQEEGERDAV
jgi:hypothetical protein